MRPLAAGVRASAAFERSLTGIGITAELDLQLFTRRLHQWRADYGSELAWNRVLGQALLNSERALALDFMRQSLLPV